jgi:hypothetical protein
MPKLTTRGLKNMGTTTTKLSYKKTRIALSKTEGVVFIPVPFLFDILKWLFV